MSRYTNLRFAPLLCRPLCGLLVGTFCCFCCPAATAQEDAAIKDISSHLAESLPEEEDLSELTERLSFYKKNPVDLNHAKPEQLKELVFLSALQISNLQKHIRKNGLLKDVLELQGIDDFDAETIRRLMPFVTVKQEAGYRSLLSLQQVLNNGNSELMLRYGQVLKKQKGYEDLPGSRYLGSPQKLLLKYRYNLGDQAFFSFTGEKDAGEEFFRGRSRLGFDFLSASLALYKNGHFKKIVIGDYSLQFGQGLTLWTGTSFGKGADVAGVAKKDNGLRSYTSTSENAFFRGAGSTFSLLKNIDLTTFISLRNLDANLSPLSTIGASGLHRTASEIRNKGSLQQFLYGTAVELRQNSLEAGMVAYHTAYDHPFVTGSQLYKQYAFEGESLRNFGSWYNYSFKSIYLFGEAAKSSPGGLAVLQGAMTSISRSLSAVILYRNYAKDHHTFYSQGIAAGSASSNEKGWYAGVHWGRGTRWDASVYADLFHFPWAKYRIDSASNGTDLMGQLSYSPRKKLKLMLKANLRLSQQNGITGLPLAGVKKENYRLGSSWELNRKIKLENRLEITRYQKGKAPVTYGYLIYEDAGYSPMSSKIGGNARLAFFNTESYENRIYAYEDDVLYGAGSGLYNGRGIRTFLNLNYKLSRRLKAWLRYAVYCYPGKEKTGTGLDEIEGSSKPEIKLQLRYQF